MSTRFPNGLAIVRGGAQRLADLFAATAGRLGERTLGSGVTDRRSSWVRRSVVLGIEVYVKTYDYPRIGDRCRGAARWTGPWNASRAAREFDALVWLQARGLGQVTPVGVLEHRRYGLLRRAVLLTEAFAGNDVATWLASLLASERERLACAIGRYVGMLHRAGFRDRNLDPRNLLANRARDGEWSITKIDSPRWFVVAAGRVDDAGARADWRRLLPQLASFGVADIAYAQARANP